MKITLEDFLVTGIAKPGDIVFLEISKEKLAEYDKIGEKINQIGDDLGISFVTLTEGIRISKPEEYYG